MSTVKKSASPFDSKTPPLDGRMRAAECFLYVVVMAMAEGIGREGATVFARAINKLQDPALRVGVETFVACIPLAILHIPLLRSLVRPTIFALALLLFAMAVADGAAYQAATFIDPLLSALAGGAVIGIAYASVLERQGLVANIAAVVVGALGMLARTLVLTTFGTRDLLSYTVALLLLWAPLGLFAFYASQRRSPASS